MLPEKKRVYGRRMSRPLNPARKEALEALLPELSLDISDSLNLSALFPAAKEIWLEIGFGNGEHLSGLMRANPDNAYIGCEPFINGMAAFLRDIRHDRHDNIRVHMDDAILLVDKLPASSLNGIYVLNPDPWPKTRHHKRRIINQENLEKFARILKPGGELIMATDVDDLAEWMVTQTSNHPAFYWTAKKADDWRTPPNDWIYTRYEIKGRKAGRKQSYLIFKKL